MVKFKAPTFVNPPDIFKAFPSRKVNPERKAAMLIP